MSYFNNRKIVKDTIFDELKAKNPLVRITIPEGLGEKVCVSLRRKDLNNKYYNISIDNQVDSVIEVPFVDLYNYNRNILESGTIILLEDELKDKCINWLVEKLNLQPVYEVISAIFGATEDYSVESIQYVINCLEANKNALSDHQLFVVRQMVNFNIIQNASADITQELIPILDNIFSNTSWSSDKSVKKLFI